MDAIDETQTHIEHSYDFTVGHSQCGAACLVTKSTPISAATPVFGTPAKSTEPPTVTVRSLTYLMTPEISKTNTSLLLGNDLGHQRISPEDSSPWGNNCRKTDGMKYASGDTNTIGAPTRRRVSIHRSQRDNYGRAQLLHNTADCRERARYQEGFIRKIFYKARKFPNQPSTLIYLISKKCYVPSTQKIQKFNFCSPRILISKPH